MLKLYNNKCHLCELGKHARNVCIPGKGDIPARVFFVAESPGEQEDRRNEILIGRTGQLLDSILANTDLGTVSKYFSNAVKCHPISNAKPAIGIIETCATAYLRKEIKEVNPELIICLGIIAAKALMQDNNIRVGELRKKVHYTSGPFPPGIPFIVTYHPAAHFHQADALESIVEDFEWAMQLLNGNIKTKGVPKNKYRALESIYQIPNLKNAKWLDLDLETTGKDPFLPNKRIQSIQISIAPRVAYYFDWTERVQQELKEICSGNSLIGPEVVRINGYNVKHELKWLRVIGGIKFDGIVNDACNDVHLWNENMMGRKDLDSAAKQVLGEQGHKKELQVLRETYVKQHKRPKERIRDARERLAGRAFDAIPLDIRVNYGCGDADKCGRIRRVLRPQLRDLGIRPLQKLMNECVKLYTDMECNGIRIDEDAANQMDIVYTDKINRVISRLDRIAPYKLNHNSPPQVCQLMYGKWKLKPHVIRQGKKKVSITSAKEALELFLHDDIRQEQREYIEGILEYRKLGKLHSTYIRGLPRFLRDGYIHANWNLTGTDTGRTSCNEPNLQQIPRDGELKEIFISRWKKGVLVGFDCSQGELRIAAQVSGEPTWIRIFNERKTDIHTATAAKVYHKDVSEVDKDTERNVAKMINFLILYEGGYKTLAGSARISREEAKQVLASWHKQFSGWKAHVDRRKAEIIDNHYIRNLFGRYRRLFVIDPNSDEGHKLLRIGINAEIQGGLTDYNKLCGVRIFKRFKKERLPALFTLEVHDQWVLDVRHEKYLPEIYGIVKEEYERCDTSEFGFEFKIPMLVDTKVGTNWKNMKEYMHT